MTTGLPIDRIGEYTQTFIYCNMIREKLLVYISQHKTYTLIISQDADIGCEYELLVLIVFIGFCTYTLFYIKNLSTHMACHIAVSYYW